MKKYLIALIITFCLVLIMSCSKSSTEVNDEYTSFFITVTNISSNDVTDLKISMVGSEDIQEIDILPSNETTENYKFRLPPPSDIIPTSFGDYHLSYIQNSEELYFGISLPATNTSVIIDDEGITVED
ncbi:MAG: hypothetical protein HQ534_08445 [Armatimonadetes bacterium]|nr:hypothetical protein [Armatimonadota bacterium]